MADHSSFSFDVCLQSWFNLLVEIIVNIANLLSTSSKNILMTFAWLLKKNLFNFSYHSIA